MRNILKSCILAAVLAALGSTTARANSLMASFELTTTSIVGDGTFSLAFQLVDGSGIGNADNTVQLFSFDFDGGSASGSALLFGGASGDVVNGLTLTNSDPLFNAAIQNFVPGQYVSFNALFTNNNDTPFPDLFLVSILDPNGNGIPTLDTMYDSFITVTLNGTSTVVNSMTVPPTSTFAEDPTQLPDYGLPAPVVTPEPSSLVLLASSCLLLVLLSLFRSQLKAGSGI
jgi:hypothetical protein